jgi:pyruvate,orthophosphate dikinase
MFFEGDRIDAMREMIIFAGDYGEYRKKANDLKPDQTAQLAELKKEYAEAIAHFKDGLSKLLPMQRGDFIGIFKALKGYPATIRFLDPPLHEFLPHDAKSQAELAKKIGVPATKIAQRVSQLNEVNPMLGHRGCRLGIAYPEITEMQARAVFEAAADVAKKKIKVKPEIMIPLVGFKKEFDLQEEIVRCVAKEVMSEKKVKFDYLVGTMIEVPRGALTADEVAKSAEFFSFGTNDLTQMALGISRDDMGNFLMPYVENEIFKRDPFATLDQTGVGQLMQIAVEKGRRSRANIKLGICGEHGGDPDSVKFCHRLGLDYVSCSPFRVPIARLAAAQAALGN